MSDQTIEENTPPTDADPVAEGATVDAVDAATVAVGPEPLPLPSGPQRYNFRSPSLIRSAEMRKLEIRHEEFVRSLTTRLAIYLRMDFQVEVADLRTMVCSEWISSLENPTHLASFGIETLDGAGLAQMSPVLAMTIVDRLLGGPGEPVHLTRKLTEIETVLVDEALELILKEWCPQMPLAAGAKPTIVSHETNPRFIQPASDDAQVFVVALRLAMGELTEVVQIGFPFAMVSPMIESLSPPKLEEKGEPVREEPMSARPREWNPGLSDVAVPLTAEWGEFTMTAGKLANLKVGDTLEVDSECVNNVLVRLARVTKFVGRLGARGKNRAIQLTAETKS